MHYCPHDRKGGALLFEVVMFVGKPYFFRGHLKLVFPTPRLDRVFTHEDFVTKVEGGVSRQH